MRSTRSTWTLALTLTLTLTRIGWFEVYVKLLDLLSRALQAQHAPRGGILTHLWHGLAMIPPPRRAESRITLNLLEYLSEQPSATGKWDDLEDPYDLAVT